MKPLFSNLLSDGGPLFMYPLLILLLICVALIIKALVKGDPDDRTRKLVGSISLFALVWGFLGHLIGLIGALDAISIASDVSNGVLAVGLKIGLLSPTFGMVVFLVARAGMIGLQLKKK